MPDSEKDSNANSKERRRKRLIIEAAWGVGLSFLFFGADAYREYHYGLERGPFITELVEFFMAMLMLLLMSGFLVFKKNVSALAVFACIVLWLVCYPAYGTDAYFQGLVRASSDPGFEADLRSWLYSPENDSPRNVLGHDLPPFLYNWLPPLYEDAWIDPHAEADGKYRSLQAGAIGLGFGPPPDTRWKRVIRDDYYVYIYEGH